MNESGRSFCKRSASIITGVNGKGLSNHVSNFLDCIKTGGTPNASAGIGTNVTMVSHMGNVAYRTQSKLFWNKERNEFKNNDTANQLILPQYCAPWTLPNL